MYKFVTALHQTPKVEVSMINHSSQVHSAADPTSEVIVTC